MNDKLTKEESAQIEEERSLYWRSIAEKLERENAALRADKERLDFLETECSFDLLWKDDQIPNRDTLTSVRAAIDAARKEVQP